jgi:hypothetical protein
MLASISAVVMTITSKQTINQMKQTMSIYIDILKHESKCEIFLKKQL